MILKERTDGENVDERQLWTRSIRGYRLLSLMLVASGVVSAVAIGLVLKIFQ